MTKYHLVDKKPKDNCEPQAQSLLALENEIKKFQISSSEVEDIKIQFKILVWFTEYFLKKWSWTSISLKKIIKIKI